MHSLIREDKYLPGADKNSQQTNEHILGNRPILIVLKHTHFYMLVQPPTGWTIFVKMYEFSQDSCSHGAPRVYLAICTNTIYLADTQIPYLFIVRPPSNWLFYSETTPRNYLMISIKFATVNEQQAWGMKKLMRHHNVKLVAVAVLKHFSKFSSTSQNWKRSLRTVASQHWTIVLRTFKQYAEDDLVVGRWGHTL